NQRVEVAWLAEQMSAVRDDVELDLRPGLLELPRRDRRGTGVVAALDDHAGDALELGRIAQQLAFLEPAAVRHVVVLDARDRDRDFGRGEMLDRRRAGEKRHDVAFPFAPRLRGLELLVLVV